MRKFIAIFIVCVILIGCSSATEELSEAVADTPTPAVEAEAPEEQVEAEQEEPATPEQEVEPEPTEAPPTEPPPTPTAELEKVVLADFGFGQDERELGFAFYVENPNPGFAIEDSQYQVAAFDAAGVVVSTESGFIELLLPGQTLGVASTMFVDEGVTVDSIEVQLLGGDPVAAEDIPTFTVDSVRYYPSEFFSRASGTITSPYDRDLEDLRVSAVAFNETGEIIGGGFTFLNFIPAGGITGVEVQLVSGGEVATVELYPTVSGLTFFGADDELPPDVQVMNMLKSGYGQDGNEIGFGMLLENPNEGFSVESSKYRVSVYGEDGAVIGVEEGYINLLLPGETQGVAGSIFVQEGTVATSVDFQIKDGDFIAADALPFFTSENVSYQPGDFLSSVTGQIGNPYARDVTDLRATAIVYNEAGEIIGGGFTYVDFVPANGKAAAEVSVTSAGNPVLAELYASVSSLSDFE